MKPFGLAHLHLKQPINISCGPSSHFTICTCNFPPSVSQRFSETPPAGLDSFTFQVCFDNTFHRRDPRCDFSASFLLISMSDASPTHPVPPSNGTTPLLMDQRDIKSDPGSQTLPHPEEETKKEDKAALAVVAFVRRGAACNRISLHTPTTHTHSPFTQCLHCQYERADANNDKSNNYYYMRDCQPPQSRAGD